MRSVFFVPNQSWSLEKKGNMAQLSIIGPGRTIEEVSSFQGLLAYIVWTWLIARINDVIRPMTSQVRHMAVANRKF